MVPEGIRQGQGLAPWAQEHGLAVGLRWVLTAVLRVLTYGCRFGVSVIRIEREYVRQISQDSIDRV